MKNGDDPYPILQHFRLDKRHWSKCIRRSLPSLRNKNYR